MFRTLLCAGLFLTSCANVKSIELDPDTYYNSVAAKRAWTDRCEPWDDWEKAGPPYQIFGSTYYVGTCGISAILITGENGHILLDGGSRDGGPKIARNIEKLGFRVEDVEILLHSHEHFDHVGGFADLQVRSGAKLYASKPAAPVLETGNADAADPQFGMHDPFSPVRVNKIIKDGETVRLGDVKLTALETPGHTWGALSWTWKDCEQDQCKNLVYMDSLSAVSNDIFRFSDHPELIAAFRRSANRLRSIPCDIALTPHPAGSKMFKRIQNNADLTDSDGCRLYADKVTAALERRLKQEASGSSD